MNTRSGGLRRRLVKLGWESKGMVILGEVLVVGGERAGSDQCNFLGLVSNEAEAFART
jgi:hypothetical protein